MKPKPPQDLWAQMDAITATIHKNDEGFTVADYCQRYKVAQTTASRQLRKLVREGKLIQGLRDRLTGGSPLKVYRPK